MSKPISQISAADIEQMEEGLRIGEKVLGFFPELVGSLEALLKLAETHSLDDDADVVIGRDLLARLEAAFPS